MTRTVQGIIASERARLADMVLRLNREALVALGDYDAVYTGRLDPGPIARGGTAQSHLDEHTRDRLRRRSRSLYRRNAIARGLLHRMVDLVVGPGFVLQVTTSDAAYNEQTEREWAGWWRREADAEGLADGDALTRNLVLQTLIDGDVGCLWTVERSVQAIAAERIVNPHSRQETVRFAGGVERNGTGRPVGYWVADYDQTGAYVDASTARRVDAANFALVCERRLSDQVRGEPALSASVARLEQIDRIIAATVTAQEVAANVALLVKSEQPAAQLAALAAASDQTSAAADEDSDRVGPEVENERGNVWFLRPGESVEQVRPEHPNQQFQTLINGLVRLVCADLGMPLELGMLDMSNVNYSSGRMGVELSLRGIQARQRLVEHQWLRWVFRNWQGGRLRDGVSELPEVGDEWDSHRWQAPAKPQYDPEAQAKGDVLEIQHHLKTLRAAVEERGGSLEDIVRQRRREMAMLAAVPLAEGGATPTQALQRLSGGIQVQDQPEQQPAEPERPEAEQPETPAAPEQAAREADTVQDTGLNGAQIDALNQLLQSIVDGTQSPDVVFDLIRSAFPAIDEERVRRMVDNATRFRDSKPAPEPAPSPEEAAA